MSGSSSPTGELEQRLTEKVVVWRQLVVMIREDAAACHEPIERRHLSTKAAQLEACALELTAALAAAGPAAPGICAHRFDSTVCVALVGHDGPHVTSNHWFPHGLVVGAAGRAAEAKCWDLGWCSVCGGETTHVRGSVGAASGLAAKQEMSRQQEIAFVTRIAALEAALRPFAQIADDIAAWETKWSRTLPDVTTSVSVESVRRARAALAETKETP